MSAGILNWMYRYESTMWNSYIVLNFAFQFMNSYITLFYYSFFSERFDFNLDPDTSDEVFIKQKFETVTKNVLTFFITKGALAIVKVRRDNYLESFNRVVLEQCASVFQVQRKESAIRKKLLSGHEK